MKSIRYANLVLVSDSNQGLLLADRLRRMRVAGVTTVGRVDEARELCRSGGVDVCLVAQDEPVVDARPEVETQAPGRGCGVPSLMIVQAVTPYLRKQARRAGYAAAVPVGIASRLLYRRIGAALQRRRAARRRPALRGLDMKALASARVDFSVKPTLH